MTETAQLQTLTAREMALAKWILPLSERKFPDDDRSQVVGLCTAAMVLLAADSDGNLPDTNDRAVRGFGLTIRDGCESRGAKRTEAAMACLAAAMALARQATGRQ